MKSYNTTNVESIKLKVYIAAALEPFIYHPIIVVCSIVGYFRFITRQKAVWKSMERTGMKRATTAAAPNANTAGAA